ncbi:MAG: SGNH/GDSL hydrolase family protein [Deltaproteobacteria bacterium]|nr:SGNH/GDSL hydrolase family protein [Deltaproteobacteria bacterium]
MAHLDSNVARFTVAHKIFLVVIVPLLVLGLIESFCRILNLESVFKKDAQAIALEMPAWMQKEKNTSIKTASVAADKDALEWLSMFEEGSGFRVRLIPGIERRIVNTFSQIPADREYRYLVRANSLGFRGPEIETVKDPAVFRIMIFGDSSSFGWGVDQEITFSSRLESLLSKSLNRRVEVANFAIPGDSSEYGRLIFDRFSPQFEYDMIILGFGANDAKHSFFSHQSQVENFKANAAAQKLKAAARSSALFRTIENLLSSSPSSSTEAKDLPAKKPAVPKRRYVENLEYMARAALERGARQAMLISLCTPSGYASAAGSLAEEKGYLYFNGQRYLLKQIPIIASGDLYPEVVSEMRASYPDELKREELFYVTSDSCHPNKLGHLLLADRIAQIITSSAQTVL